MRERIRANLPIEAVPGLSEIRLHRAGPHSGLRQLGATAPYWAHFWAGGLALAHYVRDHPECVREKRVLDLGSGSGLVAIAAAMAGARSVSASDSDAHARAVIALNAALNDVTVAPMLGDPLDDAAPDVDVLLAGDVFYDADLARRVTEFLDRCHAAGIAIFVGDPWRKPLPVARLRLLAEYRVPDFGAADGVPAGAFAFVARTIEP